MKLGNIPNVIKFAFGLVASASVALSLSNAALAAESSSVVNTGIASQSSATQAETVKTTAIVSTSTTKTSTDAGDKADSKKVETQPALVASEAAKNEVESASAAAATDPVTPAIINADSVVAPPVLLTKPATTVIPERLRDQLSTTSNVVKQVPASSVPEIKETVVAAESSRTEPAASAAEPAPVVYYQSKPLPIQPVITAAVTQPADLAAATPSATKHHPDNAPAKSNGMLGELTSMLGSVTVPSLIGLNTDLIPVGSSLALSLLILIILAVNLFVSNYGLWLRRSGYAHAARSDASAALTFATPLLMSYVRVYRTPNT